MVLRLDERSQRLARRNDRGSSQESTDIRKQRATETGINEPQANWRALPSTRRGLLAAWIAQGARGVVSIDDERMELGLNLILSSSRHCPPRPDWNRLAEATGADPCGGAATLKPHECRRFTVSSGEAANLVDRMTSVRTLEIERLGCLPSHPTHSSRPASSPEHPH